MHEADELHPALLCYVKMACMHTFLTSELDPTTLQAAVAQPQSQHFDVTCYCVYNVAVPATGNTVSTSLPCALPGLQ